MLAYFSVNPVYWIHNIYMLSSSDLFLRDLVVLEVIGGRLSVRLFTLYLCKYGLRKGCDMLGDLSVYLYIGWIACLFQYIWFSFIQWASRFQEKAWVLIYVIWEHANINLLSSNLCSYYLVIKVGQLKHTQCCTYTLLFSRGCEIQTVTCVRWIEVPKFSFSVQEYACLPGSCPGIDSRERRLCLCCQDRSLSCEVRRLSSSVSTGLLLKHCFYVVWPNYTARYVFLLLCSMVHVFHNTAACVTDPCLHVGGIAEL